MSRATTVFTALSIAAFSACTHAAPSPVSCPSLEKAPVEVAQTMRDMYAALASDDLIGWHAVTTKDYFAFDVGRRFDGDALFELIKEQHGAGAVYEWKVNDPKVEATCNTALVTYVATGSRTQAGATRQLSWLESATLAHDGQRWRIRFFHSTRVPDPAQP
ncbi:MAG: nuclear transport factor 2 family protein [Hyphomonadaceae bacterium]